jgi:hypothetical protein
MDITGTTSGFGYQGEINGAFSIGKNKQVFNSGSNYGYTLHNFNASKAWTGATSNASPYTEVLGNGTPLAIEPSYITLKFWKRLS